ncbi:MAG: hypothetical protein K9G30_09920 [Parvibaculum sp.]|nr:hypothetical protein [Parvibaculum sp.]
MMNFLSRYGFATSGIAAFAVLVCLYALLTAAPAYACGGGGTYNFNSNWNSNYNGNYNSNSRSNFNSNSNSNKNSNSSATTTLRSSVTR